MTNQSNRAQPPLEFIPPSLNPLVLQGVQSLLPLWLHFKTNIAEIKGEQVETLVKLYHQFQTGKIRFLMAFRHPSTNDPFCLGHLIWKLVPKVAKQQEISLKSPIHAHFIYDRGIPLWAGSGVGWLYSNLGGTPIQRGKTDLMGLRSVRRLFANSDLPMAAAPEGATNGHNEVISPLEPGIAQFSFWCVEDLLKAGRTEEVIILPIGIHYQYINPPWQALAKLLTQIEIESGLTISNSQKLLDGSSISTQEEIVLYERLYQLGIHLLSIMEQFYREFYHQNLPKAEDNSADDRNGVLSTRLQNLLDVALKVAEEYFNLKPNGNITDRCRRLEQAGWDCIYRQELKSTHSLSPVELGLADRIAEEANLRMWHMRVVETFVAVTGYYVKEKPSIERFAETTLLLWDFVARINGGNPFFRPQLGKQQVQMTVGEPISVSYRWNDYQSNRRQAVANLTQEMQTALEHMIPKTL